MTPLESTRALLAKLDAAAAPVLRLEALLMSVPPVTITITPTTARLASGKTQQFTFRVTGSAAAVTWSVVGGGTITPMGLYTAPATIPLGTTATVTAAVGLVRSTGAVVTLLPDVVTPPAVTVTISPVSAVLSAKGTRQFTAAVTGTSVPVVWSLQGAGTLSPTGLYTAPVAVPVASTAQVTATVGAVVATAAIALTADVIVVPPVNKAPFVTITSPGWGASFTAPATVTVTAVATDPDGSVAKVEFFNGTLPIGETTSLPHQVTLTGLGIGSYVLTARATDNQGLSVVSAPVTVAVEAVVTPPPGQVFATTIDIEPSKLVAFRDKIWGGGPYTRETSVVILKKANLNGANAELWIHGTDFSKQGIMRPLLGQEYRMLVDGVLITKGVPESGSNAFRCAFRFPLDALKDGWRFFEIEADTGESFVPMHAFVQLGATPVPQTMMPVHLAPHDCLIMGWRKYQWAMVPAQDKPIISPLPVRVPQPFSAALTRKELYEETLVPGNDMSGPVYYVRSTDGVLHTDNQEGYYYYAISAKYPILVLKDGPRGAGTVLMPMHIQNTHTGGAWVSDAWRVMMVFPDGEVRTLAGLRSKPNSPVPYLGEDRTEANLKKCFDLIGDWSTIPEERRGFHELWGFAVDTRTLHPHDPTAPPIQGFQPHNSNPRIFICDSLMNRVCMLEGDRTDITLNQKSQIKVTEAIVGLNDPWDCVFLDGVLYVSERGNNRIIAYDIDFKTGKPTFKRVVLESPGLGGIMPTGGGPQPGWLAWVQQQDRTIHRKAPLPVNHATEDITPDDIARAEDNDVVGDSAAVTAAKLAERTRRNTSRAAKAAITTARLNAPVNACRAAGCVMPEGLYDLDGWLYFASTAMAQIKRVNLTTGVVETLVTLDIQTPILSGGNFMKIAVSDGTFGPRGAVFMGSWAIAGYGRSLAWLPDGTQWTYCSWAWPIGPGREWTTLGYECAMGVGAGASTVKHGDPLFEPSSEGMLIMGSSAYGLRRITRASGERVWTTADSVRTEAAYRKLGLQLTHGIGGWGQYGLPMPWGINKDVDDHLESFGHVKPA